MNLENALIIWSFSFATPDSIVIWLWVVFVLYWLVSALNRKQTKKRETPLERWGYTLPLLVAYFLLFDRHNSYGRLSERFFPYSSSGAWIGVALTAAGVAIAFWARWHLGANWSGVVTLKEGHELIRTGPYSCIRHPIYTGMLVAMLGTAIEFGEIRGLPALLLAWLSFYCKARREESFLVQEFGTRFDEHRQHTGMFLPKLL